jgi:2-methylaconitate cis-trans-isomerase PrpF
MNGIEDLLARFERIAADYQSQHESVMREHAAHRRRAVIRLVLALALAIVVLWGGMQVHLSSGNSLSEHELSIALMAVLAITGFGALLVGGQVLRHRIVGNAGRSIELFHQIGLLVGALEERIKR